MTVSEKSIDDFSVFGEQRPTDSRNALVHHATSNAYKLLNKKHTRTVHVRNVKLLALVTLYSQHSLNVSSDRRLSIKINKNVLSLYFFN